MDIWCDEEGSGWKVKATHSAAILGGLDPRKFGEASSWCNGIPVTNESQARLAIEEGINSTSLNGTTIKTDQRIYVSYLNGNQSTDNFDKFVTKNNQTWAFDYITNGENYTNMTSLGNTINIWENSSLTYNQIINQVAIFINETIIN